MKTISFDVSEETFKKTTISSWKREKKVHLESALSASDTLGGHIVQGHVDGVIKVSNIFKRKGSTELWFEIPKTLNCSVIEKGSVTIDGVSLTAVHVKARRFSVALVPFTLEHTNLKLLKKGDKVNFEADVIGKYVEAYLNRK